jgi:hypothetical protein
MFFFHGSRNDEGLKDKNHVQDCGTPKRDTRGRRPAILPWFLNFVWRPSFRWYGHFTRYRPEAGLPLDTPRGHLVGPRAGKT